MPNRTYYNFPNSNPHILFPFFSFQFNNHFEFLLEFVKLWTSRNCPKSQLRFAPWVICTSWSNYWHEFPNGRNLVLLLKGFLYYYITHILIVYQVEIIFLFLNHCMSVLLNRITKFESQRYICQKSTTIFISVFWSLYAKNQLEYLEVLWDREASRLLIQRIQF